MTVLTYQNFLKRAAQELNHARSPGSHKAVLVVNFERLAELDGVLGFREAPKKVASVGQARRNQMKKRSLQGVNEHFESDFNTA